jgi:hypothetical protein
MPINATFKRYEETIIKNLGMHYSGLVWCELGNQGYCKKPAKLMYRSKGVKHTSIDINGLDGALKLDLDYPVPTNLENKFDVVTNYGTSEHVTNQYSVFKNIHSMCKTKGIMIHGIPLIGNWPDHCRYYYSEQFFKKLAEACGYTVLDLRILSTVSYKTPYNLVACVLRKLPSQSFPTSTHFLAIPGRVDIEKQ